MLANAIATKLGCKILLINFPDLGRNTSGPIIKFLFREARINGALLFFDECESLFMSRTKGGQSINMLLTELERFDGMVSELQSHYFKTLFYMLTKSLILH